MTKAELTDCIIGQQAGIILLHPCSIAGADYAVDVADFMAARDEQDMPFQCLHRPRNRSCLRASQ